LTLKVWAAGASGTPIRYRDVKGDHCEVDLEIPDPSLWWPNGYGSQPIYTADIELLEGTRVIDSISIEFAIRTVRLAQERDRQGRSFTLEINGIPIYCKGVDWIPCDTFIPRIPDSKYEKLLMMARDAHMNMIRVWGGGFYEQEIFYRLCDRLGLMIWQDFMYACGEYPEQPWFLQQAQQEAEHVVRRLRNHPSIVLWCGNNECEWLYCTSNPEKSPDDMKGAEIFRSILPAVCRRLDGTRPYWRSSPFGSGFPNDESNGNHHQWMVWSFWKDYREYEGNMARFVSEFGFQAPANRKTLEDVTLPGDRHPQSRIMEHHNKQTDGQERLFRFQAAHYRVCVEFDDFIYRGQLVQAEALKTGIEHWRRRKFSTAGSLFWQLNDCWPVSSWAVVDSALRPKAAYYYSRRFFSPILVSFKRTKRGVELWGSNDTLERVGASLKVTLFSFKGKVHWKSIRQITIPRNASKRLLFLPATKFGQFDPSAAYLHACLIGKGSSLSENRFFFLEPKHLQFPQARITLRIENRKDIVSILSLRSPVFVKNLRLEVDGEDALFDDNYIDLDPGRQKQITVKSKSGIVRLKKNLLMKWLS
jgi:beta-mannosidase